MPEKRSTLERFITGTFSTGVSGTITIILGFLCIMIYTRWMPKDEYGAFVILQLIMALVVTTSGFGIDFSIAKFIASTDDEEYKRRLINTTLYYRFATIIVASILILIAKIVIEMIWGSSLITHFLLYLPLLIFFETFATALEYVLSGNLKFMTVGIAGTIYSVTSFFLTVLLVIVLGQGVMGLIYTRILARGCAFLFAYLSCRISHRLEFDWDILKKMLRFGFPLYINSFLNFGFTRADSFIIGGFLGTAETATYEIARKIPESLEMLYNTFVQVYFPIVAKVFTGGDKAKVSKLLNYANRILAFGGVLIAFLVFLFRQEIVLLLFSERYLASGPIFALLTFGLVLTMLDGNLGNTLVAIGESNKPPIVNTIRATISLSGYFVLIPAFGVIGAAISNILATAIVNPVNVFFLMRKKIEASIALYLKPIVLYFIFVQITWLIGMNTYFWSIVLAGIFIIVNFILRVFTYEDIRDLVVEIMQILGRIFSPSHINT